MTDPDILFRWPFARVLAVFFLDAVRGETEVDVSTPEAWRREMAKHLAKKGAKNGRK